MSSGDGIQQTIRDQIPRDNEHALFPLSASARIVTSEASSACGLARDFSALLSCAPFHHHRARQLRRRPSDGRPGSGARGPRPSRADRHQSLFRRSRTRRRARAAADRHARRVYPTVAASRFVASDPRAKAGADARVGRACGRSTISSLRITCRAKRCFVPTRSTWPAAWPARSWTCRWRASISRRACCGACTIHRGSKVALLGPRVPKWLKRVQFWVATRSWPNDYWATS